MKTKDNYEPIMQDLKISFAIAVQRKHTKAQIAILKDMATLYLHHFRYRFLPPS